MLLNDRCATGTGVFLEMMAAVVSLIARSASRDEMASGLHESIAGVPLSGSGSCAVTACGYRTTILSGQTALIFPSPSTSTKIGFVSA